MPTVLLDHGNLGTELAVQAALECIKVAVPGYFTRCSAVVGVPPEVTDLDIKLNPNYKVYLPIVIR